MAVPHAACALGKGLRGVIVNVFLFPAALRCPWSLRGEPLLGHKGEGEVLVGVCGGYVWTGHWLDPWEHSLAMSDVHRASALLMGK